jgi:hypothetical protein
MAPVITTPRVTRRTIVQAVLALPTFALFRTVVVDASRKEAEEFVEVNGWILKRSELA